jgi:uncharacterized protein (DUF1778 family)
MKVRERSTTRETAIHIRATNRQRDLIDSAAAVLGKTRSDFMLETSCREAEDVLLDRALFQLDPEAFDQFNALLDTPPAPSAELGKLLNTPPPWE